PLYFYDSNQLVKPYVAGVEPNCDGSAPGALHLDPGARGAAAMIRFLLRRLAWAIPTLWVIVTLSFFMLRAAPGGPFTEARRLPPQVMANLERMYHLNEPV
ncbi:oligopeptide permease ABC transporter membrane protein, partial [mine drainage metagenome]